MAWFDNTGVIKGRVSDEQLEALCREALAELGRRNGWGQTAEQGDDDMVEEWIALLRKISTTGEAE